MQSFNHDVDVQRWQHYKQLELLPNSSDRSAQITFGLNWVWSGLLGLLVDELVDEQQVDYLERCLHKDEARSPGFKQLLKLIE